MQQTIIIHGSPEESEYHDANVASPSNSHWIPWLQKQLTLQDQISIAPEMPKPYDPTYSEWYDVMNQFTITNETVVIGHSSGAGFLLRYITENCDSLPKRLILIAPWLDIDRELSDKNFFDFTIDNSLTNRVTVHIFISSDDGDSVLTSSDYIREQLPSAIVHRFSDRGHFCDTTLPELLDIL
jgi:uncharacterized protein